MKRLALAALLFSSPPAFAQLPVTEDLTNPAGEGSLWFSNAFNNGLSDFFERVESDTPTGFAAPIGGFDGAMWAMEDVDGGGSVGVWTMKTIAGAGAFSNRQVSVQFATARTDGRFEQGDDNVLIQYAFDGDIAQSGVPGSGNYTTFGRLVGDDFFGASGGQLRQDTNLDGASSAAEGGQVVNQTLTPFTFDLPNGGTNLSIRIVCDIDGGSEELAFDEIRVTGILATTDPPFLAGIETSALTYTEGAGATQVTNTLTVTDTDSNIQTATVTVAAGFVAGQDLLEFTPSGGISGSFAGGVLSLSGNASPAAYQTVLRSVTYRNANATTPNTLPRTITFRVNDGSDNSNSQSRQVNTVPVLPIGTIPHTESFETNGESLTYLSNSFDAGANHFVRFDFASNGGRHPQHGVGVTGVDGNWAWACEDVISPNNPLGPSAPGVILIQDLDSAGFSSLEVTIALAHAHTPTSSGFEDTDSLQVQFAFGPDGTDGANLLGGGYTTVGQFNGVNGAPGTLQVSGASNVPDGTALTTTLQDFTFTIPNTGPNLSIRILDNIDGGSEEHVLDNIRITGVFGPANDPPQLASIEGAPISYAEGDPAVTITNTLTVTDTDDTELEGATVRIIGGFDALEDQLLFTNQNGLSGTFAGDTLTLSGTATLANYQAALRSVRYLNTDAVDASPATRVIRFTANDGSANGNFQERSIQVTPALNAPVSITAAGVCESFETDGEGSRYASSHALGPDDYFGRVPAASPPSGYFNPPIAGPGLDGTFAWAAEDSVTVAGGEAVLLLAPYTITGFNNLSISIALENPRFGDLDQWESTDGLAVDVSIDGGPFAMIANFRGDHPAPGAGGELRRDMNLNGSSSDGDGGQIVPADMTQYDFPLASTGDTIQVRVRFFGSGSEELAFDNICITGSDVEGPTLTLSDPANGASVAASLLNARGYLDVAIADNAGLDTGSITDAAAEFTLTGSAAAGVTVNGAGADMGGGIYRYTFSGAFGSGVVGVAFAAGSVVDDSTNFNVASSESFTVTNNAPVLTALSRNINEDQSVIFAAADFDAGFSDADAPDSLQALRITSLPPNGTLFRSGGGGAIQAGDLPADIPRSQIGGLTYIPRPNFGGPTDAFGWNASDGVDFAVSATTYTFNITEENDRPLPLPDTIDRYATSSVKIPVATLLANDGDPSDNPPDLPLTITGVSSPTANGAIVTLSGGTVFYDPNGHLGPDTFTYSVRDSRGGVFPNALVTVRIFDDTAASLNIEVQMDPGTGQTTIAGVGIPGRVYRVQAADTGIPNWFDLPGGAVVTDAQGRFSYVDPGPLPPTRIYRTVHP